MEVDVETTILGRNLSITDRFRDYVTEKSDRVEHLADRPIQLTTKVSKVLGQGQWERVELTLVGAGPVVRAESDAADKYSAFDKALAKLMERLRRAKDRKKVHRGSGKHRPVSLAEASATGFEAVDIVPASVEAITDTGSVTVIADSVADQSGEAPEDYCPVVIRQKTFPASAMTVDEAVDHMELVGHDFFLFIESGSGQPSVVYRRKGWDYGVIGLSEAAADDGDFAQSREPVSAVS